MCGIVVYFGGAGNDLTRVLTAMSAIIYRAPDSTGIGLFGDELEPVRTRKSLGSLSAFSKTLLKAAVYPNQAEKLSGIWGCFGESAASRLDPQRRVLVFEEHAPETYEPFLDGSRSIPTFDELIDPESDAHLGPGMPGLGSPPTSYAIHSEADLLEVIREMAVRFDLSAAVVQTLIRNRMEQYLETSPPETSSIEPSSMDIDAPSILKAFDRLLERALQSENPGPGFPMEEEPLGERAEALSAVWACLENIQIDIPRDFDRDGVRCLFRRLDAALLCRIGLGPDIHVRIQEVLEHLWPKVREIPNTDWRTLYWAEKGANVYGWGAASVLTYLQKNDFFPYLWKASKNGDFPVKSVRSGWTDPVFLDFLSQPVIAHGRWALQCAVTVQNAHPFCDLQRHRAIVLNGQFSNSVEAEAKEFLEKVIPVPFRSENSAEYFSLLWGYYFNNLQGERQRYRDIRSQVEAGLEAFHIGSQAIDYKTFQWIEGRTETELDELAFLEAAKRMISGGGQIAVAGISLVSPRRLYVAAHNRPVFLVRRIDAQDIMAVSDINAALGLFPQSLILERTEALIHLRNREERELLAMKRPETDEEQIDAVRRHYLREEQELLSSFRVEVYPLEGETIFARIETRLSKGILNRTPVITDFEGNPLPEIESFSTQLNPMGVRKDLYRSFYETHLREIPGRLRHLLRYYFPGRETDPKFDIQERTLVRRFGRKFEKLERIILAGMGSSHNVGLMVRPVFLHLMPEIETRVLQPAVVDDVAQAVCPERDLVILLSWSGTTADMVEFAKELKAMGAIMIGATEKVFADMALIAARSGGVIPVLSGEEVTVSGIKSTVCLHFCAALFGAWLAIRLGRAAEAFHLLHDLRKIPDLIEGILGDENLSAFARSLAKDSAQSRAAMIIGALHSVGTPAEAALKLEENSWTAIGKAMDYREVFFHDLRKDMGEHLVVVNATSRVREKEALAVMEQLFWKGGAFAVLTTADNPHWPEIALYSRNRYFLLPRASDPLQPFVDTVFYYIFTLEYARSHGRSLDEFPRNRVKSVAAGRSRPAVRRSQAAELMVLKAWNHQMEIAGEEDPRESEETAWEKSAMEDREQLYYRRMRALSETLRAEDPLQEFMGKTSPDLTGLSDRIHDQLSADGEIVFIPLDRAADAAARSAAIQWPRFLGCAMRTALIGEPPAHFQDNTVLILVASKPPPSELLWERFANIHRPCAWMGPGLPDAAARIAMESLGYFPLKENTGNAASETLYAALCFLFIRALGIRRGDRAEILGTHFREGAAAIPRLLDDAGLMSEITEAMSANRGYRTAFFIGPPSGAGPAWMDIFDRAGAPALAWHPFGESAHGPLATVDNRVREKFVRLTDRAKMISVHGLSQVTRWEERYIGGDLDAFLAGDAPASARGGLPGPFFADGEWHLPELRKEYDPRDDNLIIVDATRNHYFGHALDELATFGCRNARMLVVTQDAFCHAPDKRALFTHPISGLLRIPTLKSPKGPIPISGFLLPLILNIMGTAMAGAACRVQR